MSLRDEQGCLLAPSSLLSSRWSRDNLVTPDPTRLYNGAVTERVGVDELQAHLNELVERRGSFEVVTGGLGVLSWLVRCKSTTGDFVLLVPLVRDAEGVGGRSKQHVPESCHEHAQAFAERGLGRYLLSAEQLVDLAPDLRAASFSLPRGYQPVSMGLGAARVDLLDAGGAWLVPLGGSLTARLTMELVAALSYHYDPDTDGGTTISDVLVNDGDFWVKRESDGALSLRMTCARRLERGIDKNRFLFSLVQLIAYEDWEIDTDLVGLPVPIANPAVAFAGLVRGMGLRSLDLGLGEARGRELAREWISEFGRSREGRAYAPWVEEFLSGRSRIGPVDDPRRPWWNLVEPEQRRDLTRLLHGERAAASASELVQRLSDAVGVGAPGEDGEGTVNDYDREDVADLLNRCGIAEALQESAIEAWFAGWPYRNRRQLKNQVDVLRSARGCLDALSFTGVAPAGEDGTLESLERLPKERRERVLANPEFFAGPQVPAELAEEAVRCFPSFEAFMDDALHDPGWGYYARRVEIGSGGHFSTNPEALTPHYGRWVAHWAMHVWSELVRSGKLADTDPFLLIEFGAGNGRLARDVLDAVRERSDSDARWRAFGAALDYRIYELSEVLREKQRALLGSDATVAPGDARRPGEMLRRDFPEGVRGLVLSNELPDAFGVHKVILTARGDAHAVLVVPRVEVALLDELPQSLANSCRDTDSRLRSLFDWQQNAGHLLLDRARLGELMTFIYQLPDGERQASLDRVWFDETLVPASLFASLTQVLASGARDYAVALAQEDSGVVQYVNVHAGGYLRELAEVLQAGQIVTIDYGDTTQGLVEGARRGKFAFRVYCDEGDYLPRANHPYTRPGEQDLTADINFTDLARAGLEANLELTYYGLERAITGGEFSRVLSSTDQKPLAKFVSNSVFKLLVLSRGASWCPTGPEIAPLPLFSQDDPLDPERQARVASIAERLRAGWAKSDDSGPLRDEAGRVHLRLVTDASSGEQRFELARPVFAEDWQNRMTLATANTSFALLRSGRNPSSAAELAEKAMEATSTLIASLLARAPKGALACRPGCAHCCHQRVGVTVPELIAIVVHLGKTRNDAELAKLRVRVAGAYQQTQGLTRDERNSPRYPCPLLEDGLCSVYEVRPLACRGAHSLDEAACAAKLHDRERRAAYERGELPGHAFAEPARAVHSVSAGMQLGLSEGLGLDMRPLDLTAGLHLLLDEWEVERSAEASERVGRWLSGSPAFAEARGGDATDDRAQVALSGAVALPASESEPLDEKPRKG